MKKKFLAVALCMCTVFSMTGCGEDTEEQTTVAESEEVVFGDGEITLGEYLGLTAYEDDVKVTDTALESTVDYILNMDATTEYVEEGTVEEGMKIKVSYKGTVDGKEFAGGTSEGTVISMSDTGFSVKGFVDALIGHSVGETVEMDLTLPEDFATTDVAGKAVHYSATIKSIVVTVVPELNDEFVSTNYGPLGFTTVSEFYEYVKSTMYTNNVYSAIWDSVLDNAVVKSYNKEEYDDYYKYVSEGQEAYIYNYYGYNLDEYLSLKSMTRDEWNADMKNKTLKYLKEDMVIAAIAEAESIEVTEEDYNRIMFEFAKNYGYDTVEEFTTAYTDTTEEEFKTAVLTYKVQEFVAKGAKVVEGSATTPAEETTENDTTTPAAE